ERDITLAADDAARAQLPAEAALDHQIDHLARAIRTRVGRIEVACATQETLRIHIDLDQHLELRRIAAEAQIDPGHLAYGNAAVIDGRADGQAAHGFVEDHQILVHLAIRHPQSGRVV